MLDNSPPCNAVRASGREVINGHSNWIRQICIWAGVLLDIEAIAILEDSAFITAFVSLGRCDITQMKSLSNISVGYDGDTTILIVRAIIKAYVNADGFLVCRLLDAVKRPENGLLYA